MFSTLTSKAVAVVYPVYLCQISETRLFINQELPGFASRMLFTSFFKTFLGASSMCVLGIREHAIHKKCGVSLKYMPQNGYPSLETEHVPRHEPFTSKCPHLFCVKAGLAKSSQNIPCRGVTQILLLLSGLKREVSIPKECCQE